MIYHTSRHLRVIRSADTKGAGACLSGLQCFKQHFPYSTPTGSDKTYHQWLFTMKVSSLQLVWIMLSYFITLFPLGNTTRYHHDIVVFSPYTWKYYYGPDNQCDWEFTQEGLTTSSTVTEQNHCNYRALLISYVHFLQLWGVFQSKLQLFVFYLLKKPPALYSSIEGGDCRCS